MDDAKRMARVFVELADTLTEDFDVVEFLHNLTERCVQLLEADEAGLMLTDQQDGLRLMATTAERTRRLELFELQIQEGPCLDCFRTGLPITNVDLTSAADRWPVFTPAAVDSGFGFTHALPMRLRDEVIGALNLFSEARRPLSETDLTVVQAMADVATIGLLHQRSVHEKTILSEQLQTALENRVLVEQAKGALATTAHVSVSEAFGRMRVYARRNRLSLADVSTAVLSGSVPGELLGDN